MSTAPLLPLILIALLCDAAFGYPEALYARIRHPVVWIGALISLLEELLNAATMPERTRRLNGVVTLFAVIVAGVGTAWVVQALVFTLLPRFPAMLITGVAASSLIAQRSLWSHVEAVAAGLESGGLTGGRAVVSRIVGRNPQALDEAGVARAAIESLAENFSDGVTAPVFWGVLFGLPGMAFYKAVNTADSMIGHKNERYLAFGWASARLDDLINLPASRLSALWIVLAACFTVDADPGAAIRAVRRDARFHRSPNAGWPEAAMAGALGIRIAGPRVYGNTPVNDHWQGDGRADLTANDIRRALSLYRRACALQIGAVALLIGLF